jgi:4-oxalocrotonate tautomerase
MPLVQVTMITGRTAAQSAALIASLTDAVVQTLDAPRESVRVIINEVPAEHWGVAGVPKAAAPAPGTATDRSDP